MIPSLPLSLFLTAPRSSTVCGVGSPAGGALLSHAHSNTGTVVSHRLLGLSVSPLDLDVLKISDDTPALEVPSRRESIPLGVHSFVP